jgi:hypothetical protein
LLDLMPAEAWLQLDENGFVVHRALRPYAVPCVQCGPFLVNGRKVLFERSGAPKRRQNGRKYVRRLGRSAVEIAGLFNEWRDRYATSAAQSP